MRASIRWTLMRRGDGVASGSGEPPRQRLRHVYCLRGGSCAGKSTIARRIAAQHGLNVYDTDVAMPDHASRSSGTVVSCNGVRRAAPRRFIHSGLRDWADRSRLRPTLDGTAGLASGAFESLQRVPGAAALMGRRRAREADRGHPGYRHRESLPSRLSSWGLSGSSQTLTRTSQRQKLRSTR
jgi:hypothetical protein